MTTLIAERALSFVKDGDVVGLGSGRASMDFVRALGARVQAGLNVRGIPTSQATADLARTLGIPLTSLDAVEGVDIAVDGADEVDPTLDLIKGYGGALVREKIVATAAKQFVVLVGAEKLVPVLGSRGQLPIEVLPFGAAQCLRQLQALNCRPRLRQDNGTPFTTDNCNYIIDCTVAPLHHVAAWEQQLRAIPGLVGTGLFIGMAHIVLVQDGESVQVRERKC